MGEFAAGVFEEEFSANSINRREHIHEKSRCKKRDIGAVFL